MAAKKTKKQKNVVVVVFGLVVVVVAAVTAAVLLSTTFEVSTTTTTTWLIGISADIFNGYYYGTKLIVGTITLAAVIGMYTQLANLLLPTSLPYNTVGFTTTRIMSSILASCGIVRCRDGETNQCLIPLLCAAAAKNDVHFVYYLIEQFGPHCPNNNNHPPPMIPRNPPPMIDTKSPHEFDLLESYRHYIHVSSIRETIEQQQRMMPFPEEEESNGAAAVVAAQNGCHHPIITTNLNECIKDTQYVPPPPPDSSSHDGNREQEQDEKGSYYCTNAFHRACYNGHLATAKFLHEYGSDIDCPIEHVVVVSVPSNNGSSTTTTVERRVTKTNLRAIDLARQYNQNVVVDWLLDLMNNNHNNNRDDDDDVINQQDENGHTRLHLAVLNRTEEAELLLQNDNCDINITDNNGKTALHLVVERFHEQSQLEYRQRDHKNYNWDQGIIESFIKWRSLNGFCTGTFHDRDGYPL